MAKNIFLVLALFSQSVCYALPFTSPSPDEGMWLPMLIGNRYKEMKKMGFRLTPGDLYNPGKASIKDAIVWFNGGCTAEIVSPEGLLMTNHHCGYRAIVNHSTPEDNIHDNGWYAKSRSEEKPNPGMWVSIMVRMEDVTGRIMSKAEGLNGTDRTNAIRKETDLIISEAKGDTHYEVFVRNAYAGNAYFLYVMERFNDIRFVGAPPNSVGGFGGDTDNWEWPRHTGDFSLFRIYADKNNKPAAYSPDNVPYKPRHYLPISIKGIEEGDFAMIYGFPGSTNRYETSYGIKHTTEISGPAFVRILDMIMKYWKMEMDKSDAVRLRLASNYAGTGNAWKYNMGQVEQLVKRKVYEQKQKEEADFSAYFTSDPAMKAVLPAMKEAYSLVEPCVLYDTYFFGLMRSPLLQNNYFIGRDMKAMADKAPNDIEEIKGKIINSRQEFLRSFLREADYHIAGSFMYMYNKDIPKEQQPGYFKDVIKAMPDDSENGFIGFVKSALDKSILLSDELFADFIENPSVEKLQNDMIYMLVFSITNEYLENHNPVMSRFRAAMDTLKTQFAKGKIIMAGKKELYPDANSTMRITYGSVSGYNPKDAISFMYKTTLDGVMEKEKPGDEEFDVPAELKNLYNTKDYGQYGSAGVLPVNFLTNNDITGGNSGSPVLNAKGELIGLAFDGNWEAMSGDIAFDPEYKRSINVDIRYVLFLIQKFGKADYIIKELDIRN